MPSWLGGPEVDGQLDFWGLPDRRSARLVVFEDPLVQAPFSEPFRRGFRPAQIRFEESGLHIGPKPRP